MEQAPGVHGDHDLGFRRIGQDVPGIFRRYPCFRPFVVQVLDPAAQVFKFFFAFRPGSQGGRQDGLEIMFLHIPLALLAVGSDPVAHQLVGQYPGHPFDGKGEAHMLEGRSVPHLAQPAHQAGHFLVGHLGFQFRRPNRRIAEPGAHGHGTVRFGSIAEQFHMHHFFFCFLSSSMARRIRSKDRSIRSWSRSFRSVR